MIIFFNLDSFAAQQIQVSSFPTLLKGILILLLYVDDMVVIGADHTCIDWFISRLAQQFSIKDLGHLHHFLGLKVHKFDNGLFISQNQYA